MTASFVQPTPASSGPTPATALTVAIVAGISVLTLIVAGITFLALAVAFPIAVPIAESYNLPVSAADGYRSRHTPRRCTRRSVPVPLGCKPCRSLQRDDPIPRLSADHLPGEPEPILSDESRVTSRRS